MPNPSPARAAAPVTIENVRVGFGDESRMKVGAWNPVWVDLMAGPDGFDGFLEVVVPDEDGASTAMRRPIGPMRPREFRTLQTVVRPGTRGADLTVRVLDASGRSRAEPKTLSAVESVDPLATVVLTVGTPSGVAEVPTLPKYATGNAVNVSEVVVAAIGPQQQFPSRWTGYDAAEAVVIDTNDLRAMDRLQRIAEPLIEWVRQGGHLVLAVGANWQGVRDSPLARLLPATPAGTTRLTDLGAIEAFAGSASSRPIRPPMTVAKLEMGPDSPGVRLETLAASPLVVRGPFGFGRVTLVAIDADQRPFASWDDKKLFWDKVLNLPGRGAGGQAAMVAPGGASFYQPGGPTDLAGELYRALEKFPGVRLVPFGWVAFFVFLYILLIGPGDYFFLKKVLRRMELTWVTFPLIVIAVSGVAYVAAYAIKGTELRVNKVDLVDLDQAAGQVRGTSWLTLFSPQNRDYRVTVAPGALDAAPGAAASATGYDRVVSWYANPEPRFAGGGRMSLGGSGYAYAPIDQAEAVDGVRVPIWSTKGFMARWSGPSGGPALEADLSPLGNDRLSGTVTNRLSRPLKGARLFYASQVYDLGDLAPGQSKRLDPGRSEAVTSYLKGVIEALRTTGDNPYAYYSGEDQASDASRPDLLRALSFHGALQGSKSAGKSFSNVPLRRLDLSGLLELKRPMLVAQVEGAGAALDLGGASSPPRIDQATVVRVILPRPESKEAP